MAASIPKGASSWRYDSVSPSRATFVAPYSTRKGHATRPEMDPIWRSNPLPCLRMYGRAAPLTRNMPKTLVSNCSRTCSVVNASIGPPYATPALLTTTSSRPVASITDPMACSTEASSVMSSSTLRKANRSRSASARSSSAAGAFLPAIARMPAKTMYPLRARVSTIRRPKPLLLPVTRMVCTIVRPPFSQNALVESTQGISFSQVQISISDLTHVLAEAEFNVGTLLQAEFERFANLRLTPRTRESLPARVPLRGKLHIRWQRNFIDEVLDVGKCLTVELRDAVSEAVDKVFELSVWNGPVDVPVPLGKIAIEVLATEQYLEGPAASDQPR